MLLTFNNPFYLWFLVAVPFLIVSHLFTLSYSRSRALKFANFEAIEAVSKKSAIGMPYRSSLKNANIPLLITRVLTLVFVILAVSGTVLWYFGESSDFDYVLAIDSSSSMLANDFSPNRLEASKQAAIEFVDSAPEHSKIGIVSFGGTSFVEKKVDDNKEEAKKVIESIKVRKVSGTDLGGAIITSANILTDSEKSKTIILLTDGQSNVGISPSEAAVYADKKHITVFTIGVGTEEGGTFEGLDLVSKLDEETLKAVANQTSGEYQRASNLEELKETYGKIAVSTKRKLSVDLSLYFLLAALGLLFVEWALVNIKYKIYP